MQTGTLLSLFQSICRAFFPLYLIFFYQLIFLLLFHPVHTGNDKLEYYLALWTGLGDGFLELLGTSPLPDAGQELCVAAVVSHTALPYRCCTPWPDWPGKQRLSLYQAQMLPCATSCEPSSVLGWKSEALAAHISHPWPCGGTGSTLPSATFPPPCMDTAGPCHHRSSQLPDLPVHCRLLPSSSRASLPDCYFGDCSTVQLWEYWTSVALHSSHTDFCPWASYYSACSMWWWDHTQGLLGTARGSTVAVAHPGAMSPIRSHLYQALCAHCPFW